MFHDNSRELIPINEFDPDALFHEVLLCRLIRLLSDHPRSDYHSEVRRLSLSHELVAPQHPDLLADRAANA